MRLKRGKGGDWSKRGAYVAFAMTLLSMGSLALFFTPRDYTIPASEGLLVNGGEKKVSKATKTVSKNEEIYDVKYWEWQASMNKFGAAYKGDIIRHLIASMPKQPESIMEFGCSGGYILDSMPVEHKYGVELNPSSRAFAKDTFPTIKEVFPRIESIPDTLKFDVIFTTSVLEHVDCPLCELAKFKAKLQPGGVVIVGLKNDGADLKQTFGSYKKEPNHHIYTWNPLLLANILDSAGFTPCNVIGQFDAWHAVDVAQYTKDKHAYCVKGLAHGKSNQVHNLWSIAVADSECLEYSSRLNEILNCQYLQ